MAKEGNKGKAVAKAKGGVSKKQKDPNAPKRPLSAYFLFMKDVRPEVVKENPDLKLTEISTEIGKRWKDIDDKKRKKYQDMADKAKAEYQKKMDEYNAS